MQTWLRGRRGDMVWNALVIVAVLLPLASLTIDIPRYFILRARLQAAADAAAQAAAQSIDIAHFQRTSDVRLREDYAEAASCLFHESVANPRPKGFSPVLTSIAVDEGHNFVAIQASGTTRPFFGMAPPLTVRVTAVSQFTMRHRADEFRP